MFGVLKEGRRGRGGDLSVDEVLFFSKFTGPTLALVDYILTFMMVLLMLATALFALKPACSKTMRGGDHPTFLLLLSSVLLYFVYYLLEFLYYALGPWEVEEWQSFIGYCYLYTLPFLFYHFAFTTLLCALLISNVREFNYELELEGKKETSVPPNWRSVAVIGAWLTLIGLLSFVINLIESLPSSNYYYWTESKVHSFQWGGETLTLLWDCCRVIAVAWLWIRCYQRHKLFLPGIDYHKATIWFISPLLLLASIVILSIDAVACNLLIRDEMTIIREAAFDLAYRIIQTASEWLSLIILLVTGRRLAEARGDSKFLF